MNLSISSDLYFETRNLKKRQKKISKYDELKKFHLQDFETLKKKNFKNTYIKKKL